MVTIVQLLIGLFLLYGETVKGFHTGYPLTDCCDRKEVGGVPFTLVSEEDTTMYGCESNCLYARDDGMSQSRFCFKSGNLPFHCIDENGEPSTVVPPVETTTTTREVPRGPTAPPLENAQTRITLSWPNEPNDLDLYVRGYKHGVGPASCLVYYGDKCGCSSVCQDLDNASGGSYGPETVTLLNATDNSNYRYAIGVHDYSGSNGLFGSSKAKIEVSNGTTSIASTLPTSDLPNGSWWFFGCISITADNKINYYPAPSATTFNGFSQDSWTDMAGAYCQLSIASATFGRKEKSENDMLVLPPKE